MFRLVQGEEQDFKSGKTVYEGPDTSTFISGLAAGTHYFRIHLLNGHQDYPAGTDNIQVNVNYVSSQWVAILFLTGILVLASTVGAIVRGHRRHHAAVRPSVGSLR